MRRRSRLDRRRRDLSGERLQRRTRRMDAYMKGQS